MQVDSKRDNDLTSAISSLLRGSGAEAVARATPWADHWVAKCVISLSYLFFLYEPGKAAAVLAGMCGAAGRPFEEQAMAIEQLMRSERLERYFFDGYNALLRRELERSERAFLMAANLASNDPFVQFSLAFVYLRREKMDDAKDVIALLLQGHKDHPVLKLLQDFVDQWITTQRW